MKKAILLFNSFLFLAFIMSAQNKLTVDKSKLETAPLISKRGVEKNATSSVTNPKRTELLKQRTNSGSRADITTIPIGSSGNLYTMLVSEANMVSANQTVNSVIFIHRNNPDEFGQTTSQFRVDVSKDGGATWDSDIGPLNPSTPHSNVTLGHGRYPQVSLFNPAGNTFADDAKFVYAGATHDGTSANVWDGTISGKGSMDLDTTSFTENHVVRNGGDVLIPSSLVEGLNGEFWMVDQQYDGTTASDILVYKGTYNESTDSFELSIHTTLDPEFDPLTTFSDVSPGTMIGLNMGFDPTGMNGWIAFCADARDTTEAQLQPVFFNTTDGGQTWNGPIAVDLGSLGVEAFDTLQTADGPLLTGATTSFEADLVVDINGDPHFLVAVATGPDDGFSLYPPSSGVPMNMYDVSFSSKNGTWNAYHLSGLMTFRGSSIVGSISQDNRPFASRSPDGDKAFFFWVDSDSALTGGDNLFPNLYGKGLDVNALMTTDVVNFTENDDQFEGSVYFHAIAPTSLRYTDNNVPVTRIPTVFTEAPNGDLSAVFFYYSGDIEMSDNSFTTCILADSLTEPVISFTSRDTQYADICTGAFDDPDYIAFACGRDLTTEVQIGGDSLDLQNEGVYVLTYFVTDTVTGLTSDTVSIPVKVVFDNTPPEMSLNGSDSYCIKLDSSYTDEGAVAYDSCEGNVTSKIVVTDNIDYSTEGDYKITYTVSDTSGNSNSVDRIIRVLAVPQANFDIPNQNELEIKFRDISTGGDITSRSWDFGDGNNSSQVDPTYVYSIAGTYTVCLTVENCVGKNTTCSDVTVTEGTGIEEGLNKYISVHPNPSDGMINVNLSSLAGNNAVIEVYNVLGERIMSESISKTGFTNHQIDLTDRSNGVYIIKVSLDEGVITKKITLNQK